MAIIPDRLIDAIAALGHAVVLVYLVLARHARNDTRQAWPSVERIAKRAKLSPRTVRRALMSLVAGGWITAQRRQDDLGRDLPTVYTLPPVREGVTADGLPCPPCHGEGVTRDRGRVSPGTPELPFKKNYTKLNSKNTLSPVPGFEEWWSAYPRKVGRSKAKTAYAKAVREIASRNGNDLAAAADKLLSTTRTFAESDTGQAGQYCPHPTTWLSQGRYDDDPATWRRSARQLAVGAGQRHQADRDRKGF